MSQKRNQTFNDIKILSEELENAVEADKLYSLQNEAKKRAVYTAKTYDQFRNIVQAAHLQPIKKGDKEERKNVSWNKVIHK